MLAVACEVNCTAMCDWVVRRARLQRADQLADAIMTLERFDRVEQATQLGRQ